MAPSAIASSAVITPTPCSRSRQIGWPVMQRVELVEARRAAARAARSRSSRQPSGRSAATPPGRMKLWFIRRPVTISRKRRTSSRSRQPYSIIDTAPRSMPLVAMNSMCDDRRFISHMSMRIHCARSGTSMPSSFSVASENTSSLNSGDGVVHAGHVGGALHVGQVLAGLLHAGVEVADDRLGPRDRLAVELEHEPQHAVGGRVLGAHVHDHALADALVGGRLVARRLLGLGLGQAQDRVVAGQVRPSAASSASRSVDRRLGAPSTWSPEAGRSRSCGGSQPGDACSSGRRCALELHGDATDVVVLAERVAVPVVGHEDAGQVGVAVERDAEQVVAPRARGSRRRGGSRTAWAGRIVDSGTWTRRRIRAACVVVEEADDDLEPLGGRHRRAGRGRPGWVEVVDAAQVDALHSSRRRGALGPTRRSCSRDGCSTTWPRDSVTGSAVQRLDGSTAASSGSTRLVDRRRPSDGIGRRSRRTSLAPTELRAAARAGRRAARP